MDFTIGADVEMMLERDGELISAIPILGEEGVELPNGHLFYDNVLAEFTVEPATNRQQFINNMTENIEVARAVLAERNTQVRIVPSAHYPSNQLQCEIAKEFGCSPDFNAYDICKNQMSVKADKTTLRTAGGHIHFCHPVFADPMQVLEMIKLMDLYMGVPSLIFDGSPEAHQRRTLYGAAGAHRPKAYPGGEYRSLSNFWISTPELIGWIYDMTATCIELLTQGSTVESLGYNPSDIREIIDTGKVEKANKVYESIK